MTTVNEPLADSEVDAPKVAGTLRAALLPLGILAAATLAGLALPYVVGPYYQEVGYRVAQLAALATAWNLLAGYGGLVSLGSAAFIGVGAYAATEVGNRTGMSLLACLLAGGLVAGVFAVLVSPAMFRLRGLYFTIGTLALAEALRLLMINIGTFGGATGLYVTTPALESYELFWVALLIATAATAVVILLLVTPLSLTLRSVRDDEDVAKQMGVFTFRTKLWAFVVAAVVMGVVGGLQATKLGVIEPYGAFGLTWSVDIVAVAIIGGLGTRAGPWVGALIYVILAQLLRDYPEIHTAMTGVVLLLVIRFAPTGVWGLLVALWEERRHD